ncbi:MAG TPA: DUF2799 domain-containing protein [Cellvibrio sp.]|nr:DUF2799 domain-containing protein [Cellvibrio sp.]
MLGYRSVFVFAAILSIAFFSGCAQKICSLADWQETGAAQAALGAPPGIPTELAASCAAKKEKPDEAAFQKGYFLAKEQRCNSHQDTFSLAMQSHLDTENKCSECPTKDSLHTCWQDHVRGGQMTLEVDRLNETKEMLVYVRLILDECKSSEQKLEANGLVPASDPLRQELTYECSALEQSLSTMENDQYVPIRQKMLSNYRSCADFYKDSSAELLEYCGSAVGHLTELLGAAAEQPQKKPAQVAPGSLDNTAAENHCKNTADAFHQGMQVGIQNTNSCNQCEDKDQANACWVAHIKGGEFATARERWLEIDGMLDHLRQQIEACKTRLVSIQAQYPGAGNPVAEQAKTFCGQMQLSLYAIEKNYSDSLRSRFAKRIEECTSTYKAQSPALAKACESESTHLKSEEQTTEAKGAGTKRMINFSE